MKGPYTTQITSRDGELLDTEVGGFQTLATHINFAHLRAAEWVMAEVVDQANMETRDATGKVVRFHVVYFKDSGRLANSVVRERVS